MLPEPLAYHQKWLNERPDDYGDSVRFRLELATTIPAVTYVQAQRFREIVVREWREEVFSKVDVLACPTTAIFSKVPSFVGLFVKVMLRLA